MQNHRTYLETEELQRLEEAATNLRDRLLIRLLFHLGCRISEALGITVEDVDMKQGTITIQHLKTRMKLACPRCNAGLGKSHIFCPRCGFKVEEALTKAKENRRVRTLPVDADTLKMLKEYIQRGGPVLRDGRLLVFGIGRGQGWRVVTGCAEKAGLGKLINPETGRLRGVSPHRLRDAFAVHAVKQNDSGDGLRLLQEHLGHASFNTTAKYRKISGREHRNWYDTLWQKNSHE
ncbi:MAG: tyrosine-type recombinase/integrase [Dehalococcoidia bacterium]|nr:tyrosine-type recombinase/integrase [Dehalococcoidia bacterium]